jgi:hypothetical protein
MQYLLEVRSQKSRGSAKGFGGPDTYVAVQVVPEGVEPLVALNRDAAKKRGIVIHYFGEGYQKSSGPRSQLGHALAEAKAFIAAHAQEVK